MLRPMRALPRPARARASATAIDAPLLGVRGDLVVADLAGIRRLAARMNATGRPAARRSRPARSARSGSSTRSATCSIARYEADRRPGAIAAALDELEHEPRAATRRACSIASARSSRAPDPTPEPPRAPARGAAADPDRQREPGGRAAASSSSTIATWRRARAIGTRSPASRRRSRRAADRRDGLSLIELMRAAGPPRADVAGRPAPLHPGELGVILGDSPRAIVAPARPRHRRSSPRRSARSICGSVAAGRAAGRRGPAAGRPWRHRASSARPTSPRRSRPTRPGCRGSC